MNEILYQTNGYCNFRKGRIQNNAYNKFLPTRMNIRPSIKKRGIRIGSIGDATIEW